MNRGIAQADCGNLQEAMADLDKALAMDANLAAGYRARAAVFDQIGDAEKAEEDRRKFEELSR